LRLLPVHSSAHIRRAIGVSAYVDSSLMRICSPVPSTSASKLWIAFSNPIVEPVSVPSIRPCPVLGSGAHFALMCAVSTAAASQSQSQPARSDDRPLLRAGSGFLCEPASVARPPLPQGSRGCHATEHTPALVRSAYFVSSYTFPSFPAINPLAHPFSLSLHLPCII
jgi:hypothetical protein